MHVFKKNIHIYNFINYNHWLRTLFLYQQNTISMDLYFMCID